MTVSFSPVRSTRVRHHGAGLYRTTRKPTVGDKRTRNGRVSTGSKSFVSFGSAGTRGGRVRIDYRCGGAPHSCVAFNVLTRPAPERLIRTPITRKTNETYPPPSAAGLPSIWSRKQISVIENEIWPAAVRRHTLARLGP